MTAEQMQILREWMRSEIAYAIAKTTVGEDMHTASAHFEEKEADLHFLAATIALANKPK